MKAKFVIKICISLFPIYVAFCYIVLLYFSLTSDRKIKRKLFT